VANKPAGKSTALAKLNHYNNLNLNNMYRRVIPAMQILSIDPGKTCGYAVFEYFSKQIDQPELVDMGECDVTALPLVMDKHRFVDKIIYEQYIVLPQKAMVHTGSSVEAAQAIGMINMFAMNHKIPTIQQMPAVLPLAMKLTRMKKPKGHLPDKMSAWLHGVWYLNKIGKYSSNLVLRGKA
jgi:hypothetical protein